MAHNVWQLQDTKKGFIEILNKALEVGPQIISQRDKEIAVIVSIDQYRKLTKSQPNLLEFFRQSPLVGVELDLERHSLHDVSMHPRDG
jgi:antitoxin Phd